MLLAVVVGAAGLSAQRAQGAAPLVRFRCEVRAFL